MKTKLLPILILFSCNWCIAQQVKPNIDYHIYGLPRQDNLKGKVKSIKYREGAFHSIMKFDEHNNVIEFDATGKDSVRSVKEFNYYNAIGNLIETDVVGGPHKTLVEKTFYEYDQKDSLISIKGAYVAGGQEYQMFEAKLLYDTVGNLIDEKEHYAHLSFDSRKGEIPDSSDTTSQDGEIRHIYDAKGRLIQNGGLPGTEFDGEHLIYDDKGRLRERSFSSDEMKNISQWDENGNQVDTLYQYGVNKMDVKRVIKYDPHHNIREEIAVTLQGDFLFKSTPVYKYDKMGNWIETYDIENGKKGKSMKREIEYYK